jgi:hypothetical protein
VQDDGYRVRSAVAFWHGDYPVEAHRHVAKAAVLWEALLHEGGVA